MGNNIVKFEQLSHHQLMAYRGLDEKFMRSIGELKKQELLDRTCVMDSVCPTIDFTVTPEHLVDLDEIPLRTRIISEYDSEIRRMYMKYTILSRIIRYCNDEIAKLDSVIGTYDIADTIIGICNTVDVGTTGRDLVLHTRDDLAW